MRDPRPVIAVFVTAVFILGMLSGSLITDHAWERQVNETREVRTP